MSLWGEIRALLGNAIVLLGLHVMGGQGRDRFVANWEGK